MRGTCVAPRVPIVDYLLGGVGSTQSLIFRVAHANYIPMSFFGLHSDSGKLRVWMFFVGRLHFQSDSWSHDPSLFRAGFLGICCVIWCNLNFLMRFFFSLLIRRFLSIIFCISHGCICELLMMILSHPFQMTCRFLFVFTFSFCFLLILCGVSLSLFVAYST